MNSSTRGAILAGATAYVLAPWHMTEDSLLSLATWGGYPFGRAGSALALGLSSEWWLLPILAPILVSLFALSLKKDDARLSPMLVWAGVAGLALMIIEGFAIRHRGYGFDWIKAILGSEGPKQAGMGLGAFVTASAFLVMLCHGLAYRGFCRGDVFIVTSIGAIIALIAVFVFMPVVAVLQSAFLDLSSRLAPLEFLGKLFDNSVWGLDCLGGGARCGVAWNTLFLAILVGVLSTALGLAFALIVTRTGFRAKGVLRVLTVLPIITPPFVIGLALILLFGRSGVVSAFLSDWFEIPRSRWIYGLPGVLIAQLLAFTPISFLVLIGVVQGISPALEEATQTLRATRWTAFRTVTWPLMRPGLANAFLLGFVESMADFGNPLVLGGNFEVLSTKIFFAVVGAAVDPGRAAVLAIILLAFTLAAFWLQNFWLGKKSYTTVTGKGDTGLPQPLPKGVAIASYATAIPWAILTVVIYLIILVGGFVRTMGRDYTPTLEHYLTAFRVEQTERGLFFSGSAWNSLITTLEVAGVSAPLTAVIGILTAWLLTRNRFAGQRAFEFGTMLSFAIPGTVVGVSYILAFNIPPIELTGGGLILIICFVFRNMPVGVRSGIAGLSQLDKSLDEASLTLGARSFTTLRKVVLPLLRPAIIASLVYSFVRAMTAVSAVIFLVSAEYNLATSYIVGRVEAGEFGLAIAYSSALIVIMIMAIGLIQLVVGERRLGRRQSNEFVVGAG
ncbi:iron ABC transporter permease [Terrarubrum flagellatum]|uniref:ABC transporter permease n=1 Tax=Terrirubrum flagellatum TaxID=2895980 RepID=UPI003145252F